jgi:phage-related protein
VADLAIRLRADSGDLSKGLSVSKEEVSGFVAAVQGDFAKLGAKVKASMAETSAAVTASTTAMKDSLEGLQKAMTAGFELLAVGAVIDAFENMAKAAGDARESMDVTAAVAHSLGHAFDAAQGEKFLEQLATSAAGAGVPIEQLREGYQKLAGVTKTQAQQDRALEIAIGLAKARHLEFAEAVGVVNKVLTGHQALLGRVGIGLTQLQLKTMSTAQVMEYLGKSGDAAVAALAGGLDTQLGETANQFAILQKAIGEQILPLMIQLVEVVNKVVVWFRSLSPEAIRVGIAIAAIATVAGALIGVVTALGAVTAILAAAWGVVGTTLAAVIGPVVVIGTAIAGVITIIVLMATHWQQTVSIVQSAGEAIQHAVDAFVTFIAQRIGDIRETLQGMGDLLTGHFKEGLAKMADAGKDAISGFVSVGEGIGNAMAGGFAKAWTTGSSFAKQIATFVSNVFTTHAVDTKSPTVDPNQPWSNASPGSQKVAKGSDAEAKQISDLMKAYRDGIDEMLAQAAAKVEAQTQAIERAKIALEQFKLGLKDGKVSSKSEEVHEEQLIAAEMQKQLELAKAVAQQKAAMLAAAAAEAKLASTLPASDKERLAHQTELNKAAREHTAEADRLETKYLEIKKTMVELGIEMKEPAKEFAEHMQEAADAAADIANAIAKGQLTAGEAAGAGQKEALRVDQSMDRANGKETPESADKFAIAIAEVDVQLAKLAQSTAATTLANDQLRVATTQEAQDKLKKLLTDDQAALDAATVRLTSATNDLAIDEAAQAANHEKNAQTFTNALNQMTEAVLKTIPGINAQIQANGQLQVASFNWIAVLVQAFEATKEFKDIMNVVKEIMKAVSEVLDKLRPIIDDLLHVLVFWINVIIDVYNALLGWLTGPIPLLSQNFENLNNAMDPFIQIMNDLPTLNQLASGAHPALGGTSTYGSLAGAAGSLVRSSSDRVSSAAASAAGSVVAAGSGVAAAAPSGGDGNGSATITINGPVVEITGNVDTHGTADIDSFAEQLATSTQQQLQTGQYGLDRVGVS